MVYGPAQFYVCDLTYLVACLRLAGKFKKLGILTEYGCSQACDKIWKIAYLELSGPIYHTCPAKKNWIH